jgi:hypothetical protein
MYAHITGEELVDSVQEEYKHKIACVGLAKMRSHESSVADGTSSDVVFSDPMVARTGLSFMPDDTGDAEEEAEAADQGGDDEDEDEGGEEEGMLFGVEMDRALEKLLARGAAHPGADENPALVAALLLDALVPDEEAAA